MGKEHKDRVKDPCLLTTYDPAQGAQEGPDWISEEVRHKRKKHYDAKPHLLVYANFRADGLDVGPIAKACDDGQESFSSIWVLWNNPLDKIQIVQLFPSDGFADVARQWTPVPDCAKGS